MYIYFYIIVYDTKDTRNQWLLYGHDNKVTSLLYHPELNYLISSSLDHTVRIWDPPKFN